LNAAQRSARGLQGGGIAVKSETNHGSTFTVILPLSAKEAKP